MKRPASDQSGALEPLGSEAGGDQGLELHPELVALLLVHRNAQRADATEGIACELLDRVERPLGPCGQIVGSLLPDRSIVTSNGAGMPVARTHRCGRSRRLPLPAHRRAVRAYRTRRGQCGAAQ